MSDQPTGPNYPGLDEAALQQLKNATRTFPIPNIKSPTLSESMRVALPTNENLASAFHRRLVEWIDGFESKLNSEQQVGIRLVTFGQAFELYLENMSYWNPSLISFIGHTRDGNPAELIQHVSQISVLLMALPKNEPGEVRRVGFALKHELSQQTTEEPADAEGS